ncbi:unnamed protein product [Nesidiocoris tenuis]|uniref:Uncharacterized protein n=1 Tax=Nesidiocoris tenuis TaxID=355587 RepID=A0A6H5GGZ5_9HEMI|nr:unnamed protein product [Nesidiocoris tenuis]
MDGMPECRSTEFQRPTNILIAAIEEPSCGLPRGNYDVRRSLNRQYRYLQVREQFFLFFEYIFIDNIFRGNWWNSWVTSAKNKLDKEDSTANTVKKSLSSFFEGLSEVLVPPVEDDTSYVPVIVKDGEPVQLTPLQVSHSEFWARYLFRRALLEDSVAEEERKRKKSETEKETTTGKDLKVRERNDIVIVDSHTPSASTSSKGLSGIRLRHRRGRRWHHGIRSSHVAMLIYYAVLGYLIYRGVIGAGVDDGVNVDDGAGAEAPLASPAPTNTDRFLTDSQSSVNDRFRIHSSQTAVRMLWIRGPGPLSKNVLSVRNHGHYVLGRSAREFRQSVVTKFVSRGQRSLLSNFPEVAS